MDTGVDIFCFFCYKNVVEIRHLPCSTGWNLEIATKMVASVHLTRIVPRDHAEIHEIVTIFSRDNFSTWFDDGPYPNPDMLNHLSC